MKTDVECARSDRKFVFYISNVRSLETPIRSRLFRSDKISSFAYQFTSKQHSKYIRIIVMINFSAFTSINALSVCLADRER